MIWEQTKWKTGLGRQRKLQIKLQDYEDANYCAQPKNYERRKKMGSGIKLHLSPPPPPPPAHKTTTTGAFSGEKGSFETIGLGLRCQ